MKNEEKYPLNHLYCVFNFLTVADCADKHQLVLQSCNTFTLLMNPKAL